MTQVGGLMEKAFSGGNFLDKRRISLDTFVHRFCIPGIKVVDKGFLPEKNLEKPRERNDQEGR